MMKNNDNVVLGIDVSKDKLDYYYADIQQSLVVKNTESGCEQLVKLCRELGVSQVVFEATGGYERLLAETLEESQIPYSIVNPTKVRHFGRAQGKLAKTDPIDAKLLQAYGSCLKPRFTKLHTKECQQLGELLVRRGQLVKMQSMEKNRKKSPLAFKRTNKSISTLMEALKLEIKQLDQEIYKAANVTQQFSEQYKLLTSCKGVGPILSATLIAFLPELGNLSREQIAALVGVAPYDNQSGKSDGNRSIFGGRRNIRDILYMSVIAAIRSNVIIRAKYRQLQSRGKPHKVATVACMRKILVTLNALVRDSKSWESLRFSTSKQEHALITN